MLFTRRARCCGTSCTGIVKAVSTKRPCALEPRPASSSPRHAHDDALRGQRAVCRFRPEPNVETLCKGSKCLEERLTGAVVRDDLEELITALPHDIRQPLLDHPDRTQLLEVVLDLGRRPEARFHGKPGGEYLREAEITAEDLLVAEQAVGEFGADNRAGVAGTLHRISAMRSRKGGIVGLTCRVGRAVTGHTDMLRDLVESGQSVLLLGRPGVGKTTVIREIARVLADELRKRVVIVDTSNEIGGDSDVPHAAIGGARRMQVADADKQHLVMVEAVENHMPQVVIVDEIGTEAEALACRSIAERGVQLIGTAHGQLLENLIKNVTLCDLIGGVQSVTLGDEQAKLRGTNKSILERKGPPTFPIVVEIRERSLFVAHWTQDSVDNLLVGKVPLVQVRERDAVSCQVSVSEVKYSEVQEPSGGVRQPVARSNYDADYEAALAQAHGGGHVDEEPGPEPGDRYNDIEIMKLVGRTTLFARSTTATFLARAPMANGAAAQLPQFKSKKAKASARRALRATK